MRVLFVCTANQCRSPLAAAIARQRFADLPIEFESAGLIDGGEPSPETGVQVAAARGLDLRTHLSRKIDRSSLERYDLVLTMSRDISRDLVATDPGLWPRTFTVKQFSAWAREHPRPRAVPVQTWIATEAMDRPRGDLLGTSSTDDVVDPVSSPARVWRRVADELEQNIEDGFRALFPA